MKKLSRCGWFSGISAVVFCAMVWSAGYAQDMWTVYTPEGLKKMPSVSPRTVYVGEGEIIDYGQGVVTGTGRGTIIPVEHVVIPGPGGKSVIGPADKGAMDIAEDKEGNLWFVFGGSAVSKFDGVGWTTYTTGGGGSGVAVDRQGNVWFSGSGVSKFDGRNWTRYDLWTMSVTATPNGDVWFNSSGSAYKFDGSDWRKYTPEDGLGHQNVFVVTSDRQGTLWFGLRAITESYEPPTQFGVTKFDGTTWVSYGHEYEFVDCSPYCMWGHTHETEWMHYVNAIIVDRDDTKWVSTANGLLRFDGKIWREYREDAPVEIFFHGTHGGSADPGGALWIATGEGLAKQEDGVWSFFPRSDLGGYVGTVFFDREGRAWISTTGGIIRWDHPMEVGIEDRKEKTPKSFDLFQNRPNPFNSSTQIGFSLKEENEVSLKVVNHVGQAVKVLLHERYPLGNYQVRWDGKDEDGILVGSGTYLYQLKAGGFVESKKMLFLK